MLHETIPSPKRARALLRRHGSPLHVVSAERLDANARAFLAVPPGAAAGCDIFYSYKTNPVPGVLRRLHALGIGAEVISPYELWLALRLGVPPARIVYNGPAKPSRALADAIRRGVGLICLNHPEEIDAVARAARRAGRRARVALRVATRRGWSGQLGFSIESGEALAGYRAAARRPELRVVGMHAHLGPPIRDARTVRGFVAELLRFSDVLHERAGVALQTLDLGGGLALPGVAPKPGPPTGGLGDPRRPAPLGIAEYVRLVVRLVERHSRLCGRPRPRIALEPGRALTGDAQVLLATVLALRETRGQRYALIDAGTNLAEALRRESHAVVAVAPRPAARLRRYTLAGPLCSPDDVLQSGVRLPQLRPGDPLAILDAGAYFVPYQTNFSFPRPAIVMVERGRSRLLRRAERFPDLVALDAD